MGSSYPFAKDVLAVMSPLLYSSSRYVIAGLFMFAVLILRRQPIGLPRRDWLPMLLLSLVGVCLFQACWGLAHGAHAAQRRRDRDDHDDRLRGDPRLDAGPSPVGARLERHRHGLRGRRAGGQQQPDGVHPLDRHVSTAR